MRLLLLTILLTALGGSFMHSATAAASFSGKFFRGSGDVEYLQLLDIARRMFDPDPEFQNMPMLYTPAWNGFVEGPTWGAWWIQNSYGPTYCALPFWQEPYTSFVQNSQDLWFDQMGDGKREGGGDWHWVAPDGCLCDAAAPGWIYYKQGDGRIAIHDWGMEFTAAGVVMQSELLLISRDPKAIAHYLPKLERCANFIETRRDPKNNCFLAGPAGNLLAPSYAGWKKPDGTYDKAYLTGLSVTYIAGLDRIIELEKLAGNAEKAGLYSERRELARKGLATLTTDEGYFIRSLDPDGTKHGVYGAPKYGYFDAISNHDAICFRVADDAQAEKIYAKIASIPGLRRHDLIITNCPGLDDMYEPQQGLWEFGRWVNGGHWSTCEARMMMGYYRLGKCEDARRSMKAILKFARQFRMDNNLTNFGSEPYQPKEPINCVYDTWGVPAAFVRGLFEYLYRADGLTILPHIPPGITELEQRFPIRFGAKRLLLATVGSGPISGVAVNGKAWDKFDAKSVFLPYGETPEEATIQIALGGADLGKLKPPGAAAVSLQLEEKGPLPETLADLDVRGAKLRGFCDALAHEGLGQTYAAAHARLAADYDAVIHERRALLAAGTPKPLTAAASQAAADQSYEDTANKLCDGLDIALKAYGKSEDPVKQHIHRIWQQFGEAPGWVNIRASGKVEHFRREGDHMRMTLSGAKDSSCGWAHDLPEPLVVPEGAELVVDISGSATAKYFVDLMTPEGGVFWQTLWQRTPTTRTAARFKLPKGARLGQIILYTMTDGDLASNDFWRVTVEAGGKEIARFVG